MQQSKPQAPDEDIRVLNEWILLFFFKKRVVEIMSLVLYVLNMTFGDRRFVCVSLKKSSQVFTGFESQTSDWKDSYQGFTFKG